RASQIVGPLDAGTPQIAQQLADKNDVRVLEMMVIAEPEQVLLRDDQARLFLGKDALLLQSHDAAPDGLEREVEKPRERRARDALLDSVGFHRVDAGEALVKLPIVHDGDDIGIEDGVDDEEIERIEVLVMPKHLADRTQHVSQRVTRYGADEII